MNLQLLKKVRTERGITQEQMAFYLGYKDKSSYCQIETGNTKLPISKIKMVKDVLQLSNEMFCQIFLG